MTCGVAYNSCVRNLEAENWEGLKSSSIPAGSSSVPAVFCFPKRHICNCRFLTVCSELICSLYRVTNGVISIGFMKHVLTCTFQKIICSYHNFVC